MAPTQSPEALLRQYWGYSQFRPLQREIIVSAAEGTDTLAVLPTGAGKSLCFQVAGLLRGGLTLVITPLIALMHDQVAGLVGRGLAATYLNSSLEPPEIEARLRGLAQGRFQFLYLSPEWLHQPKFRLQAPGWRVALLVIDEAHCISQWGFDFRPSYLRIRSVREVIPKVPTLAVTATATPGVQLDITEQLGLQSPARFVHSFARPNLRYLVLYEEDRFGKLLEVVQKVKGSALVYVRSRKGAAALAQRLAQTGEATGAYHAGLPAAQRTELQERWLRGEIRLLVATNAFGMGIDKPDVRLVVHWDLPPDLESYYQEAGRAGRDGKVAFCALLYSPGEVRRAELQLTERFPTYDQVVAVYEHLAHVHQLPLGEQPHELVAFEPEALATGLALSPRVVASALRVLEQRQLVQVLADYSPNPTIYLKAAPEALRDYTHRHEQFAPLIEGLLRQVGGEAFVQPCPYHPGKLAETTGLMPAQLAQQLTYLAKLGLLSVRGAQRQTYLRYLQPYHRLTSARLGWHHQAQQQALAENRLQHLLRYATDTTTCRQVQLSAYFGETLAQPCGKCDICSGRHTPKRRAAPTQTDATLVAEILALLAAGPKGYGEVLAQLSSGTPTQRPVVIQRLVREGVLRMGAGFRLEKVSA